MSRWLDWLRGIGAQQPPPAPPEGDPERVRQVQAVLDDLRPMLALDGGGVELLAVADDGVRLRLTGACGHCSLSPTTVSTAVEPELRRRLDWLRRIDVR